MLNSIKKIITFLISLLIASPLLVFGLYIVACAASAAYISLHPIITPDDVKNASWISSPTTALHFTGILGTSLMAVVVLMSLAMSAAKSSIMPLVIGALATTVLLYAGSNSVVLEGGIYSKTIKIGCYVWDAKDCQEMLEVPVSKDAFKKYPSEGTASYTPEYEKALSEIKDAPNPWFVALGSMPGGYFVLAPWTLYHRDVVLKELERQRSDLAIFKEKQNSLPAKKIVKDKDSK